MLKEGEDRNVLKEGGDENVVEEKLDLKYTDASKILPESTRIWAVDNPSLT